MEDVTWDDVTCVRKLQGGGKDAERAVAVLYTRYKAQLYKHLCWRFPALSHEEVEDRVHDAFVSFIQDMVHKTSNNQTFVGTTLRPWLWTIATHKILDLVRSAAHRSRAYDAADNVERNQPVAYETTPAAEPDDGMIDCVGRAWKAFAAREQERAEVLRLRIVEGWSIEELAAHFARKESAMRQYISQCRQKFRPYLQRWCGEYSSTATGC